MCSSVCPYLAARRALWARTARRSLANVFGTTPEWNPGRNRPRTFSPCEPTTPGRPPPARGADSRGPDRLRGVRLVELPVLLQLPDQEPEDAGDAEDDRGHRPL